MTTMIRYNHHRRRTIRRTLTLTRRADKEMGGTDTEGVSGGSW